VTLSERQIVFARYLLSRFGFTSNEKMDIFLDKLEKVLGRYEWNTYHAGTSRHGEPFYKDDLRWNNSYVIECLLKEKEIKGNLHLIKRKQNSHHITASDISNFHYCPVAFIIQKSFFIDHPTNPESTDIGSEFHEACRLSRITANKPIEDADNFNPEILNSRVLKAIRESKVLFEGHTQNDKYFKNDKYDYVGQPDYILSSINDKIYVVEEKFHYHPIEKFQDDEEKHKMAKNTLKMKKSNFFDNHLIQLQSYVDLIEEYPIRFGILVNWFYEINAYNDSKYVYDFSYKIIYPSADKSMTARAINEIRDVLQGKTITIKNINLRKCGACSVNKYCVHKSDNYNSVHYPYDINDMRLKYAEFPEILKKNK
jgi:CRISPR/Cas system-associated exonuclease Cas4 (RecB family)